MTRFGDHSVEIIPVTAVKIHSATQWPCHIVDQQQ